MINQFFVVVRNDIFSHFDFANETFYSLLVQTFFYTYFLICWMEIFYFFCGNNRIFYTIMCNMMHLLFLFIAMLKSKINSFETIYIKLWPIDNWELIVWLLSNVQVYETFCKSNIFNCGYGGIS